MRGWTKITTERCHPEKQERSRNFTNIDCISVQFLYLRYTMTGLGGGKTYRFFTNRSELEIPREGFRAQRRIYFSFYKIAVHPESQDEGNYF